MYAMLVLSVAVTAALLSVIWGESVHDGQWLAVQPNSTEFIHTLPFPSSVFKYKFRGNETGGLYTLFEVDYLNDGSGKHMHTREDELFHIIDGNVQFFVDGKQFCGSTGDYAYVPRHVSQAIRIYNIINRTKPVRIQILLTPSGLEGFLDEVTPLYYTGQNNLTLQNEIAVKYGIINLEPVDWQDLGCFMAQSSSSSRLTSFILSFTLFVKNFF
jgi:mannose-6-phosphate isomerase-like protein (cupin superfamily)